MISGIKIKTAKGSRNSRLKSILMKTITFIGTGNMASAIIGGMIRAGNDASKITVYDKFAEKAESLAPLGVNVAKNLADACATSEFILLAVKPQNYAEVLTEFAECGIPTDKKLFISIAAGISTDAVSKLLGRPAAVVRCMPNTPLQVGAGVTALAKNSLVSDEDFALVRSIFDSAGMTLCLDEAHLNTVICANGSSPAYFYYFIDAVVRSAKAQGLECDDRILLEAVCKTVIGSAEMLLASGKTPSELIRAVTSPNGTTERAMNVLYEEKVDDIIDRAMRACTDRAEEMSKSFGA